ncbi:MAG: F0F1 ATP synthase subunit epsilon [Bacteroidales bacterium]|jgi:F-type H+-transporting ATPase subunit epsilon|nr:F0F1 ATP synthase subunit epsilon [Bacteroidales bacterium]
MFKLRIITPNKLLFEGEVESVTLPGTVGSFSVLDNHAPIISSLERGKVVYRNANCVVEYELDSGFAEVRDNTLTVCMEQL